MNVLSFPDIPFDTKWKVKKNAQRNHTAFVGNKYSIQRDHMIEVLQEPEQAKVPELELEQSPVKGQGQQLGPVLENRNRCSCRNSNMNRNWNGDRNWHRY
jgi:hypothetical protein